MKVSSVPQRIIVPTYYYVDEFGLVQFDTEQMVEFFKEQVNLLESCKFDQLTNN